MNTSVKISGTVKFFSLEKSYGFITTKDGDDVFIGKKAAGDLAIELVKGASVVIDFVTKWVDGAFKRETTSLISVSAPPAPIVAPEPLKVTVLDTVIWYNEKKGMGFMHCGGHGFSRDQAFIGQSILRGIVPGAGMPLRAVVVEAKKGPAVKSFQWGSEVVEAHTALLAKLHAEDGAAIDANMSFEADPLTSVIEQHKLETMRDLGQLPVEAIEEVEEAPVIATAKPKRVKTPKPAKQHKAPSIDAELIAHTDSVPPNCLLAGLVALTNPGNGAAVSH